VPRRRGIRLSGGRKDVGVGAEEDGQEERNQKTIRERKERDRALEPTTLLKGKHDKEKETPRHNEKKVSRLNADRIRMSIRTRKKSFAATTRMAVLSFRRTKKNPLRRKPP